MEVLALVLVFVIGSVFGSFIGVLAERLPKGESVLVDRSHCASCRRKLAPFELIPIVSYLLQKGKCRSCKAKIPEKLLYVEVFTGFAFVFLYLHYLHFGLNVFQLIYLLAVSIIFIAIFLSDLDFGIIPDQLVLAFLLIVVFYSVIFMPYSFLNRLEAGLGFSLFFLFLNLITRGKGMGFGDVKLAFPLGFFLGFPNVITAFYVAFLTGALVSIILVLWGKKSFQKSTIPFGPFLIFAAAFSYFFGPILINYFTKMFF